MQYISYKNVLIFGLIIGLLLSVNQCTNNKKIAACQAIVFTDTTNHYKNELGTITATKKVLELEKNKLKDLLYSKDETLNELRKDFSKVKTITQTETNVVIDSVIVPFETKTACDFTRNGKQFDKWLQFDYSLSQSSFEISNFTMLNKQTTITGFKRKWFLGKQTYTTDVTNSNPYVKTIDVQTVQVVVPKRFYDTRLFNIGIGVIGGMLLVR